MKVPGIIHFAAKGTSDLGFLGIAENSRSIPFDIKRVFWLYEVPGSIERGFHAHKATEQILICLAGKVEFFGEMPDGSTCHFVLDSPGQGVYIPPDAWHYMKYETGTIQLVLASSHYAEDDYLRSYEEYIAYYKRPAEGGII